jgi:formylmethanofuran--tetrahydromethanopterin N-formyltransferase
MGEDQQSALAGAEAAVDAIADMEGVITSFACGVVASGSKVGCRNYRFPMPASTNHAWCPALRGLIGDSQVPDGVESIYEIVMNGLDETAIRAAMKRGIGAAVGEKGVLFIGASNFEGRLGQHHFHLHDLLR